MATHTVPIGDATADPSTVGGKTAGLVTLARAGIPVPPGFVVTTSAFFSALPASARAEISARCSALSATISITDLSAEAKAIQGRIHEEVARAPVLAEVADEYERLSEGLGAGHLPVAVRSSGVAEDGTGASFAGLHDSFLGVIGPRAVIAAVVRCWASAFTARAIAYRRREGLSDDVAMAVVVQRMVPAGTAGVLTTLDPANGDRSSIAVESIWGLGAPLMTGLVTPDFFLVDTVNGEIVRRSVAHKPTELLLDASGATHEREVEPDRRDRPSLRDEDVRRIAKLGRTVERLRGRSQLVEFVVSRDDAATWIVQARPETRWGEAPEVLLGSMEPIDAVVGVLTRPLARTGVPPEAAGALHRSEVRRW